MQALLQPTDCRLVDYWMITHWIPRGMQHWRIQTYQDEQQDAAVEFFLISEQKSGTSQILANYVELHMHFGQKCSSVSSTLWTSPLSRKRYLSVQTTQRRGLPCTEYHRLSVEIHSHHVTVLVSTQSHGSVYCYFLLHPFDSDDGRQCKLQTISFLLSCLSAIYTTYNGMLLLLLEVMLLRTENRSWDSFCLR